MLVLIQLINRMKHLGYSIQEITLVFSDLNRGEINFDNLTDILGLDELTSSQFDRAKSALPKVQSAIACCEVFKVS